MTDTWPPRLFTRPRQAHSRLRLHHAAVWVPPLVVVRGQIVVLRKAGVGRAGQTASRDGDIRPDVGDEGVAAVIVALGPHEAQHQTGEVTAVEGLGEVAQQVDLDAAHGVAVIGVPADAEDDGVDGGGRAGGVVEGGEEGGRAEGVGVEGGGVVVVGGGGGTGRGEAGPAEVDA